MKVGTLLERFKSRYIPEPNSGCWLWTGTTMMNGYGVMSLGKRGKKMLAHRYSYEEYKGAIGDGLVLDHLCRVQCCVNPDHLEAVKQKVNVMRGIGIPVERKAQTHCVNGHEFTDSNTVVRRGCRECRICVKESKKAWWRNMPEEKRERIRAKRRKGNTCTPS